MTVLPILLGLRPDVPFAEVALLSRTATLPVFSNFHRSSSLLRPGLVIQSHRRKLQHGSSLAGNEARKTL